MIVIFIIILYIYIYRSVVIATVKKGVVTFPKIVGRVIAGS